MSRGTAMALVAVLLCAGGCDDDRLFADEPETEDPTPLQPEPGDDDAGAEDPGPDPGAPELSVEPPAFSAAGICGEVRHEVVIANDGDADLHVTGLALRGEGWSFEAPSTPFTLVPGGRTTLVLTGTSGRAVLAVESDDPVRPVAEVALEAIADAPPEAVVLEPAAGAVLPIAGAVLLRGQVSDDEDPPEALATLWTSSLDGIVAAGPGGADGGANAEWPEGTRSPGTHVLTLTVTDSCGQSTRAEVTVCQQHGYTYDAFDLDHWHYEGAARWNTTDGYLELTPADTGQVGTAFETDATVSGDKVEIEFLFFIGEGTGADGISLTALDTSRMPGFLGGTGCGIGYGGAAACTGGHALPGWSIEVDTWFNQGHDPTEEDHLAFTFDGDVDSPVFWTTIPEMEDTGWHRMRVQVDAPHVLVSIDEVVYLDQDLAGTFAFPAYVGFTGGTGAYTNRHLIDVIQVTEYTCE